MIWNVKDKYAWYQKFALFPTKIGLKWIWLELFEERCGENPNQWVHGYTLYQRRIIRDGIVIASRSIYRRK